MLQFILRKTLRVLLVLIGAVLSYNPLMLFIPALCLLSMSMSFFSDGRFSQRNLPA
jgi:hypothetical protein